MIYSRQKYSAESSFSSLVSWLAWLNYIYTSFQGNYQGCWKVSFFRYWHWVHQFSSVSGSLYEWCWRIFTSCLCVYFLPLYIYHLSEIMFLYTCCFSPWLSCHRSISFVYPYGATLTVQKPSTAVLSTGSTSFPLNRPICAFYESKVMKTILKACAKWSCSLKGFLLHCHLHLSLKFWSSFQFV